MPDNPTTALVRTAQSPALARVSNILALTDKLLIKPEEPFLIPYRKGDKWGFCDRNKNIVIDCIYRSIHNQNAGFWSVNISYEENYIIDNKGRHISGPFEWIDYVFQEGYCCVKFRGKYGFIGQNGKYVISPISYIKSRSCEGVVSLYSNKLSISVFASLENGLKINRWGSFLHTSGFSEGLAAFIPRDENEIYGEGYRVGFLDHTGRIVISPIYEIPHDSDLPDPYYDKDYVFKNGIAFVCINDKWGAIDKNNKIIIPVSYQFLSRDYDGLIVALENDKIVAWFDDNGDVIKGGFSIEVAEAYLYDLTEELLGIRVKENWGFSNKQGEIIVPTNFEEVSHFSTGLAPVQLKNKWGYINRLGQIAIPLIYDKACSFSNNLAAVKKNGKWGFINNNGDLVIDFQYAEVREDFENGIARVARETKASYDKTGYINKNGIEYWED